MMIYHRFYHEAKWHPRQVDELYEDEEYWLPVLEDASSEASGAWAEIQARANDGKS
jgi:hypothetical protein